MRQDAFHFMFAAAATQPQVREILPKEYSFTELKSERDRVSIWECDTHFIEGYNGTEPKWVDWAENFDFWPNRDGIQHEYANTVQRFTRSLVDLEKSKPVRGVGHSQGSAHAFASAFYKWMLARQTTEWVYGTGGPAWALDERKVKGSRAVCGRDPVTMECFNRFRFFKRIKRLPKTQLEGCPGGKKLCILDHDLIPYANGFAIECKKSGDVEGERKMHELMEVCNQQWRGLEGV